jgi:hypothetical protein
MKIVSFDSARVTWLFPLEEFLPAAGLNSVSVIDEIATRYGFTIVPKITTREDMSKNGLHFGMGRSEHNTLPFLVTDFIIYNDGLVAVAEKTGLAEAFLDELFLWTKNDFGFREITSGIRKLYASTIIVDFESPISALISGYERIAKIVTANTTSIMIETPLLQFSRIDFEADKRELKDGQVALPKFILERRAGVGFSQERFFSVAPMHTNNHLNVLSEIERMATALSAGSERPS